MYWQQQISKETGTDEQKFGKVSNTKKKQLQQNCKDVKHLIIYMPVIVGPSGSSALNKKGRHNSVKEITTWAWTLLGITVCEHSSLCHPG